MAGYRGVRSGEIWAPLDVRRELSRRRDDGVGSGETRRGCVSLYLCMFE